MHWMFIYIYWMFMLQDGGPSNPWEVQFGRRDSTTANSAGTSAIPGPFDTFDEMRKKFDDVGLDSTDMVALSGNYIKLIN